MSDWNPNVPQAINSELPPYGIKPHWVTFRFSAPANRLYDLYNAHVSRDRGDRVVWPTLDDMAAMMGLSRGDKVTPYMRELEAGGAISVRTVTKTGGKGRRYVVTLKVSPPAGYDGPLQSSDWHRAHQAEKPRKASMGEQAKNAADKSAGQEVHPLEGVYVHPVEGGDVHPVEGVGSINHFNQNQEKKNGGSAGGQSAGGFARAGASSSAASKAAGAAGGSAADSKDSPTTISKRLERKATRVTPARPVPGEQEVWVALAPVLAEAGTGPGVQPATLRKAVRLLLGHDTDARGGTAFGLYPRRPEHALVRINRGWYRAGGPERSARGYDGPDAIRRPVGYLATLLTAQECIRPECELGVLLTTGEECQECGERAAERVAATVAARLEQETVERAAGPAAIEEHQEHGEVTTVPGQRTTWRCEGSGCGRVGRGEAPDVPLCDECQEDIRLSLQEAAATGSPPR